MTGDDEKLAPKGDDDAIIAECKEYMQTSTAADGDNRSNGLDALRFIAGDQWDPQARAQRQLTGRPCLTINKLPTYLHQVTNDQRQNVPSIKVHPVDDGADVETAEVLQGLIRHMEYASNADVCYDTAVNSAAAIGYGYFRLVTEYCDEESFDQDIVFKRIRNAFTVYFDPASTEPDGSDQTKCAISTKMPKTEFKRLYPKAQASDDALVAGLGDRGTGWFDENTVRVTEYYRVSMKTATLVLLSNGETGWKDELDEAAANAAGVTIVKERESAKRTVEWFKLSATDVLERAEIKCKWIPVFPVWGDEVDLDGKVVRSGLVKNAMDPAKMYNVWMTAATEEVALRPKAKYVMAEGQEDGHEDEWAAANNSASPFITYKPVALGGMLAPAPQRQPLADVPAGMLTMAQHASDDIKATTGIFDASLGARGNETSGKAIIARQREGDVANFHYTDNLMRTLRHVGRCIINMIPSYYDAERVVRIMGEDQTVKSAEINKPMPPQEIAKQEQAAQQAKQSGKQAKAIKTVLNDLTVGTYDVTVSTGPQYSTLRQEAAQAMVEFGQSWPKLMDIAGDKVVKAMDWPGADEIAERIKKTIPPELTEGEDGEEQQDIPPQVRQMLAQLDQTVQALSAENQQLQSGIEKAKVDAAAKVEVANIQANSSMDVAELTGAIKLLVENMKPPPALAEAAVTQGDGGQKQPDMLAEMAGMLQQLVTQQAAPKRKKLSLQAPSGGTYTGALDGGRLSITGPSGQVYGGEIMDDDGPQEPIQ